MSSWEGLGKSDEWYTPPEVFEALGCEFDLDVAGAVKASVPARGAIYSDSLDAQWQGFIWMNPPFGGRKDKQKWLDKFIRHGNGIALVPDRTSAPWFQDAFPWMDAVLFTNGKIKFLRPDGTRGEQPGNGTALMAIGIDGETALMRAAQRGFGLLTRPVRIRNSRGLAA